MAVITEKSELTALRRSGAIAAEALQTVIRAVRPGITTRELNTIAEAAIIERGASPSFKGYEGYPYGLCTSVNDEVVHGMPSDRVLEEGDVIGLDIGANYKGLFSDHAITVGVGTVSAEKQKLMRDTAESLRRGLSVVRPGKRIGDIGAAIEAFLQPLGYGIVTQLTGHGLGYAVHEPPTIPNFGSADTGPEIVSGMVLAIEPMVNLGSPRVMTLDDGWTVVTADHQPSAHFEHTVLVTDRGYELLTVV